MFFKKKEKFLNKMLNDLNSCQMPILQNYKLKVEDLPLLRRTFQNVSSKNSIKRNLFAPKAVPLSLPHLSITGKKKNK